MSEDFRAVVNKRIPRDERIASIDRLGQNDHRTNLSVLVRAEGLDGEYRRRALERLIECNGTEQVEALADDPSIPDSLRRRASEAV